MFNFIKRHKILSLIIFLNVVAILVVILIIVSHSLKTATISIRVAPIAATVELNGAKYENMESHNVAPGDYHVKISMEGMQTKELDFSIGEDGFVRVWDYLLNSNGTFDYYLSHQQDELLLKDIISKDDVAAQNFIAEYQRMAKIREILPLEYYDNENPADPIGIFIEQSKELCDNKINCLSVYGGEKHQDIVLKLIRDAGYSPDDFEIIIVPESEDVTQ